MPDTRNNENLRSERAQIAGITFEPLFVPDFNSFQLSNAWPGLLYVMRRARRRGKGHWLDQYGETESSGGRRRPTSRDVARRLFSLTPTICGFATPVGQDILSDWLASSILETVNDTSDPDQPVIRAVPLHYFSAWIDLPQLFTHMRGLPELLGSVLSNQAGPRLSHQPNGPFGVKCNPDENLLFRVFGEGWRITNVEDLAGDVYDDTVRIDPDVLLALRLGQSMGSAPEQVRGERGEVPVYRHLCEKQLRRLREDVSVLLRAYSGSCPPAALLELLSATLVTDLTTYLLCHVHVATRLYETGDLVEANPSELGLYVDVTDGAETATKRLAQRSFDSHADLLQRYITVHLGFRWLAKFAQELRRMLRVELPDPHNNTVEYLAALAQLRLQPDTAREIDYAANHHLIRLHEAYKAADESPGEEAAALLCGQADPNARPFDVWIRVLSLIQNDLGQRLINKFYVGCTGANASYGLMRLGNRKEPNCYILSNAVLEALVHGQTVTRNSRLRERRPPLREFLDELKQSYGIYVDEVPRSLDPTGGPRSVRNANLEALKERLRLLGLFRAVSDAEAMQRIRPRYAINVQTGREEYR